MTGYLGKAVLLFEERGEGSAARGENRRMEDCRGGESLERCRGTEKSREGYGRTDQRLEYYRRESPEMGQPVLVPGLSKH